jgi:hypothetical protein
VETSSCTRAPAPPFALRVDRRIGLLVSAVRAAAAAVGAGAPVGGEGSQDVQSHRARTAATVRHLAGTADTAVPRGVFRRAIAAEISVTMSPTGKTSIKVMPMLKRGFL